MAGDSHLLYQTKHGRVSEVLSSQARYVLHGSPGEGNEWLEICGVPGCCTKSHLMVAKRGAGYMRFTHGGRVPREMQLRA